MTVTTEGAEGATTSNASPSEQDRMEAWRRANPPSRQDWIDAAYRLDAAIQGHHYTEIQLKSALSHVEFLSERAGAPPPRRMSAMIRYAEARRDAQARPTSPPTAPA